MVNGRGIEPRFHADIPLGQGICYLSTEGDGELTLCLPFDLSRTEILDMELDSEGQLLVWTCEEDTLFLTVADPDTGAVRQRLELLETEDPDLWLTHQGENCLLVVSDDDEGRFCLLERQEGAYTLVLRDRLLSESVEDPCYPVEFRLFLCGTSVLWDGERMIWTLGEGAPESQFCPSPSPWRCTTERGGGASLCWTAAWAGSGRSGPTTIGSGTRTRWPWPGRMPKGLV